MASSNMGPRLEIWAITKKIRCLVSKGVCPFMLTFSERYFGLSQIDDRRLQMCVYGKVDPTLNCRKPAPTQHWIESFLDRPLRQSAQRSTTSNLKGVVPLFAAKEVVSNAGWTRGMTLFAKVMLKKKIAY